MSKSNVPISVSLGLVVVLIGASVGINRCSNTMVEKEEATGIQTRMADGKPAGVFQDGQGNLKFWVRQERYTRDGMIFHDRDYVSPSQFKEVLGAERFQNFINEARNSDKVDFQKIKSIYNISKADAQFDYLRGHVLAYSRQRTA
jgi:hypothetical protein